MVRINWAGQTGKKTRYNGESKIVLSPTFRIENLDFIIKETRSRILSARSA